MNARELDRRDFVVHGAVAGAVAMAPWSAEACAGQQAGDGPPRKIKVGVIGCGSVSNVYLPHLAKCEYVELVSACDRIPARAARQAERFKIPHAYPHIEQQLGGAPFELLVNLTDMQEHEHLNRAALIAGRHVWSEKPLANSLAGGVELLALATQHKARIWGAPTVVNSPQFAFMAKAIQSGKLGRVAAAHADYGHLGPNWSSFFYERGGGSMPDLGVYNLTTLTGLLGPARSVIAMTSVITPKREIAGKGPIEVTAEDNAMLVIDHGEGTFSHVQCGFNYFNPHGHEGKGETRHTLTVVGTGGAMGLVGYDWEPFAVDLATSERPTFERQAKESGDYVWQQGASLVAECLATGREVLFMPDHALHVVEIMIAARESQATGRRVELKSKFKWPVVA